MRANSRSVREGRREGGIDAGYRPSKRGVQQASYADGDEAAKCHLAEAHPTRPRCGWCWIQRRKGGAWIGIPSSTTTPDCALESQAAVKCGGRHFREAPEPDLRHRTHTQGTVEQGCRYREVRPVGRC